MQKHERLEKQLQLEGAQVEVRNTLRTIIPENLRTSEIDHDHWIQELILEVSSNMIADQITAELRLPLDKANELFVGRTPYSSQLEIPSDPAVREVLFVSVGKYLFAQYEFEEASGEVSDKTKLRLKDFLSTVRGDLFQERRRDITDAFLGIDSSWKDSGEVTISDAVPGIVRDQVGVYLTKHPDAKKTIDELTEEVLGYLQGGQLSLVAPLLNQTTCPDDIFEIISGISDTHFTDPELVKEKMEFAVDSIQFLRKMGISVEKYFQVLGYKSLDELERIMTGYLTDTELVDSYAQLLIAGFPKETQDWDPQTVFPISYRAVQRRLAQNYGFSPTLTPFEAISERSKTQFETAKGNLSERFPFANSNHVSVENRMPVQKGTVVRSTCYSYWDENRNLDTVIVTDPRTRPDSFQTTAFHEYGHGLHFALMSKAVKAGWYSETDVVAVPSSFLEEIALLFQEFGNENESSTYSTGSASEGVSRYSGIYEGMSKRYYAQMGLMQLQLFTAIEAKLDAGTQIDVLQLHDQLSPQMAAIRNQGLAFEVANSWLYYSIDPLRMDDGMLYVDPNLRGEKLAAEQDNATINLVGILRQRFGLEAKELYKNKEARALFIYVLAVSGDTEQRKALPEVLPSIDIRVVYEKLNKLGINEAEI